MPPKIIYTALFVDNKDKLLEKFIPKHRNLFAHHMTIAFRPGSLNGIEVGKKVVLKITGRAFDEKGDVLIVERYKTDNKYPHITLSCGEGISPTYSKELLEKAYENGTIEILDSPVEVSTTEGFFDGFEDKIL